MAFRSKANDKAEVVRVIDPQWQDIVEGRHADPHAVLGGHVDGTTTVIRVFRPDAITVAIRLAGGQKVAAEKLVDGGIFEARVPVGRDRADLAYQVEATYSDDITAVTEDPYRFWPTVGDLDLYLYGTGRHEHLWKIFGSHVRTHQGVQGTSFVVWAPNAKAVRVVGAFNYWQGRINPMRRLGESGVWELFIPGVGVNTVYKYELIDARGNTLQKADPFAFATEHPPATGSVVTDSQYTWSDSAWMKRRSETNLNHAPFSTYEVHLGSWRRPDDNSERFLTYRELADQLPAYVQEMGFTHVEFMPVAEHPFGGSWGYQVSSYYAPSSRFGSPEEFRILVDALHAKNIGVIVDWVPAHFPKDSWSLAQFDGTSLYEHSDPHRGEHPDWGTLIFNLSRHEVRNFLLANALYWLEEFHVDALRVDAVASMLYLDYSRKEGEWTPNEFGGRENLEAVSFLKEMNELVYRTQPGAVTIAEESTAWPGVSRPTYLGGLGFGFKWNMGWMHDTLDYFEKDPIYRRYHHNNLTFGLVYAWQENFVLPLSHDEVVHGKGSLIGKMPGDEWQAHANLRSMYAWMWAHPGKKLLFMGGEFAQDREWNHDVSLDWHLLENPNKSGVQRMLAYTNEVYKNQEPLWGEDFTDSGFRWIDASDIEQHALSFLRTDPTTGKQLVCVANLSPVPRYGYRVGLPHGGAWKEVLNTDAIEFGGSGVGNMGAPVVHDDTWHGLPAVAELTLPPLGVLWLVPAS